MISGHRAEVSHAVVFELMHVCLATCVLSSSFSFSCVPCEIQRNYELVMAMRVANSQQHCDFRAHVIPEA